ncbi:hypothetical protein HMPREF9012_1230 [Bacteroidetes bacterium oral taxon 272 str. F0290]|nr:hypothetical protein HMPREF9012_1230 [Bacteroidetes bacterium oral taxon 272 str. F0290]
MIIGSNEQDYFSHKEGANYLKRLLAERTTAIKKLLLCIENSQNRIHFPENNTFFPTTFRTFVVRN